MIGTNLERVQKLISQELNIDIDKVTQDAHLFDDLNFDSLDSVQVVLELENEFDIEIEDDEIDNVRTVQNILDLIDDLA
jgi:acyl carrier protein